MSKRKVYTYGYCEDRSGEACFVASSIKAVKSILSHDLRDEPFWTNEDAEGESATSDSIIQELRSKGEVYLWRKVGEYDENGAVIRIRTRNLVM